MMSPFVRKSAHLVLISLAAVLVYTGLLDFPSTAQGTHNATLLCPGDPGFDAVLDSSFPGLRDVRGFQTIEPFLAILKNDSPHHILAYVIQWTITNPDGSTNKPFLPVLYEPLGRWEARGQRALLTGQKVVLKSSESDLVSPLTHWPESQFGQLRPAGGEDIVAAEILQKLPEIETPTPRSIRAALDGIIYDDGLFIGPNHLKLYERVMAEQLVQRDEGKSLLKLIESGSTAIEISNKLNEHIQQGIASEASDTPNFYDSARGRAALRLLTELQGRRGRAGLQNMAARLARAQVTRLRIPVVH